MQQAWLKPTMIQLGKFMALFVWVSNLSPLVKAVNYTLEYWPELSKYIESGEWPIDNNPAENAIRPFVIGRKNTTNFVRTII